LRPTPRLSQTHRLKGPSRAHGLASGEVEPIARRQHFHFHVCVSDGVFCEDSEGSVQFHEATHLTVSDWD